jgi:hypothetical protein
MSGPSVVPCSHLDQIRDDLPAPVDVCPDCVAIDSWWVHLRQCLICGYVGCCDSSPNRHASRHAADAEHPIVSSVQPGEDWSWCYVDEVAFVV